MNSHEMPENGENPTNAELEREVGVVEDAELTELGALEREVADNIINTITVIGKNLDGGPRARHLAEVSVLGTAFAAESVAEPRATEDGSEEPKSDVGQKVLRRALKGLQAAGLAVALGSAAPTAEAGSPPAVKEKVSQIFGASFFGLRSPLVRQYEFLENRIIELTRQIDEEKYIAPHDDLERAAFRAIEAERDRKQAEINTLRIKNNMELMALERQQFAPGEKELAVARAIETDAKLKEEALRLDAEFHKQIHQQHLRSGHGKRIEMLQREVLRAERDQQRLLDEYHRDARNASYRFFGRN